MNTRTQHRIALTIEIAPRMTTGLLPLALLLAALLTAGSAWAGETDVVAASAERTGAGLWRFEATVRHADAGWEHYADAWEVVAPDGTVIGTRVLLHPHDLEQPFTRGLSGVAVPEGLSQVIIRARDSVHGFGGTEVRIDLDR